MFAMNKESRSYVVLDRGMRPIGVGDFGGGLVRRGYRPFVGSGQGRRLIGVWNRIV